MKIAIDAADLCDQRVDGTRIYIKNVLDHLGAIGKNDSFFIYLKGDLNEELRFKRYPNYFLRKSKAPFFWTQSKLLSELKRDNPDILWMPLQTVPFLAKEKIKIVVTIHDLAFRFFKNQFPLKDWLFLSFFTKKAVARANKIIAVSQNTKRDLLKEYKVNPAKIKVVYHGYNKRIFNLKNAKEENKIKNIKREYGIKGRYILYVGALQPRKNLEVLLEAFNKIKGKKEFAELRLVLAGPKAWLWKKILQKAKISEHSKDIIFTGHYKTKDLPHLMGGAEVFVFPSLYEGFGIPVLEAMASGLPVISSDNSSLPEVGGQAPRYFQAEDAQSLAKNLEKVLEDDALRNEMKQKGLVQVNNFSWEKCAQETYKILSDSNSF